MPNTLQPCGMAMCACGFSELHILRLCAGWGVALYGSPKDIFALIFFSEVSFLRA